MMRVAIAIACLLAGCEACKATEGGSCSEDSDCQGRLVCRGERCVVGEALYGDMARQSGVPVTSEAPRAASGGAGAVHVRSAAGEDVALALCAPNERLVGGWCDPPGNGGDNASLTDSGAVGYTKDDTIGARWKCHYEGKAVRAFALCQVVPP